MMKAIGFFLHLVCALSLTAIHFLCYVFVDDANVMYTQDVNTTGKQLRVEMQDVVDHWEGGLCATGGAIEPSKCYWYLIDQEWTNNHWQYQHIDHMPGDISIQDNRGNTQVTVQRYQPFHAEETLGVFLVLNGNNSAPIRKLGQKAEEFANHIRTGKLSHMDAWHSIDSTIMKALDIRWLPSI
jgi:hypothetical protein